MKEMDLMYTIEIIMVPKLFRPMLGKLEIQLASSDEKCNFFQLTFFRPNFKTSSKKTFEAPHPTSINGIMYADLVREKAARPFLICIQVEMVFIRMMELEFTTALRPWLQ